MIYTIEFEEQNDELYETLQMLYPDDNALGRTVQTLLTEQTDFLTQRLYMFARIRYVASLTGAMRWPWSQECCIEDRGLIAR